MEWWLLQAGDRFLPLNCISIQDILRHDRISSTAGCKYFHYAPLLYESRV
jgi:hypothetical protein